MPNSIASFWYAYLIFVGASDFAKQDRYIDAASMLDRKMTPAQVLEIMGPPSGRYEATGFIRLALLNFQPKHWYWGERVDIHRLVLPSLPILNPFPYHVRIFGYADNDVVVRWSSTDQIMEITLPSPVSAPAVFHDLLEAQIATRELFDTLRHIFYSGG